MSLNPLAQLWLRAKVLTVTSLLSALTVLVGLFGLWIASSATADVRAVNGFHTNSIAVLTEAAKVNGQLSPAVEGQLKQNERLAQTRVAATEASLQQSTVLMIGGMAGAVVLGTVLGLWLANSVVSSVHIIQKALTSLTDNCATWLADALQAAGLAETASNLRTMVSTFKLETEVADDHLAGLVTARRRTADWTRPTLTVTGRAAR